MALATPILYSVPAFDGAQGRTFTFSVSGGNQVIQNRLTIRNNATNAIVYQQIQTSFAFAHILPANVLANNVYYNAYVETLDAQGNISSPSNTIQFYCFTQPTVAWTNVPINYIVNNSSFEFVFTYNQVEGELLNSYIINLYSLSGSLISTSGEIYNQSNVLPPTNFSYIFSGFDDKTGYIIECNAITVNGTQITSGQITFNVTYEVPSVYTVLELTNNCQGGYITIKSNFVGIEGISSQPPIYIDNHAVDLRADGATVTWDEGYKIYGNFTYTRWGMQFKPNSVIGVSTDDFGGTVITGFRSDGTNVWADLSASGGYFIYSNKIPIPLDTDQICIWIRYINNLYDIKIENKGAI